MPFIDRYTRGERALALKKLQAAHQASLDANDGKPPDFDPCLVMFWGEMGGGKSLSAVGYIAQSYAHGIEVYHNSALDFGQPLDMDKLRHLRYTDCIIHIDEIEEVLNSYRANSNLQLDVIGAMISIRHNGVQVVTTGQYEDEINWRAIRRAKYSIQCRMTGENSVGQWRTHKPRQYGERKDFIEQYNMQKYMPLYKTRRQYVIGGVRRTAQSEKAQKDLKFTDALQSILEGCAEQGIDRVTSAEAQLALEEHYGIKETLTKIGRRLGALDCERERAKGSNHWNLPERLLAQFREVEEAVS